MQAPAHELTDRTVRVVVGTTKIEYAHGEGFDMSFGVVRHNRIEPNTSEVVIRNLPETVRERLAAEFSEEKRLAMDARMTSLGEAVLTSKELEAGIGPGGRLRVEAGYGDALELLSEASMVSLTNHKAEDGVTWLTSITAQDGYVPWKYGFVSQSVGGALNVSDIMLLLTASIKAVFSEDAKATIISGLSASKLKRVANGYVMHGPTREVVADFLDSINIKATYQNGEIVLVPSDQANKFKSAVVLGPGTGLLDPIVPGDLGKYVVRSLLLAKLEPHRQVLLSGHDGERIGGGIFRVDQVTHTGDTAGDAWHSRTDLRPTDLF